MNTIKTTNYKLLLILVMFCAKFCALDLNKNLKHASNKHVDTCCSFVDYVYVINLDKRPFKFQDVEKQLNKEGIHPYRFSAVNGWEISINDLQTFGIRYEEGWRHDVWGTFYLDCGRRGIQSFHKKINEPGLYLTHYLNRGAIGIILSHLSILKDAYESNYDRVWIMEDDIFVKTSITEIAALVDEANRLTQESWDVLYTDLDTYGNDFEKRVPCYAIAPRPDIEISQELERKLVRRVSLSDNITKLGNRYGAYSYIISRRGIKRILDHFEKYGIFLPYDMEFIYIPDFVQLASNRDIVTTRLHAPSDNGAPNYIYE